MWQHSSTNPPEPLVKHKQQTPKPKIHMPVPGGHVSSRWQAVTLSDPLREV